MQKHLLFLKNIYHLRNLLKVKRKIMKKCFYVFVSLWLSGVGVAALTPSEQAMKQAKQLSRTLVSTVQRITDYQEHWQKELYPSWYRTINRPPNAWFSDTPYQAKIQQKLDKLKVLGTWYEEALKAIRKLMKKIRKHHHEPSLVQQLCTQLIQRINFYSRQTLDDSFSEEQLSELYLTQVLIANEYHLQRFEEMRDQILFAYQPSMHIVRHWASYSLLLAFLLR